MKQLRIPSLFLAAALQLLPLCRTVCTNPAVTSSFAVVLRWGVAAAATLGAYDSVSGASQVFVSSPTNATGYVAQAFSFTITLGGETGSDPGAKINAGPLPAGLTNQVFDYYNHNPPDVHSVISGIPTTAVTNQRVFISVTHPQYSGSVTANLYLTILPGPTGPQIDTQPVGMTNVAGGTVSFSVAASGADPLDYQWLFNELNLSNATSNPLVLSNIRTSDSGDYRVIVSDSGGSITSSPAPLWVTLPASPTISPLSRAGNQFVFTFDPIAGLTNAVETNASVGGGSWNLFTNIPPPDSASSISVTDTVSGGLRFYRIKLDP